MKKLFILMLLFITSTGIAQVNKFSTIQINDQSADFHGSIKASKDLPITFHLQAVHFLDDVRYSVKGYYFYDSKEIPIPLVGFYDELERGLVLYHIENKASADSILDNEKMEDIFEYMEFCYDFKGYKERFICHNYDEQVPKWDNKTKSYPLTINGTISMNQKTDYLRFVNGTQEIDLNLKNLFGIGGWSVKKEIAISNGYKVLLYTEHPSKGYVSFNGMCGGGINSGFAILTFDKDGVLQSKVYEELDNCYSGDYISDSYQNESKLIYVLTKENYNDENADATTIEYVIDLTKLTYSSK